MAVRLERLKVNRYRHLSEPADLQFGDGAVLVLGRNGTGKSNLLRLIDVVVRFDFRLLERDSSGFDIEFECTVDDLHVRMQLAAEPKGHAERAPAELGAERLPLRRWSYVCDASNVDLGVHARFDSRASTEAAVPDPFHPDFRTRLTLSLAGPGAMPAWLVPLAASSWRGSAQDVNGIADEALDLFHLITSVTDSDAAAHFTVINGQRAPVVTGRSLVPDAVWKGIARRSEDAREEDLVEAEVPWLRHAASACGFSGLAMRAHLLREEREVEGEVDRTYGPFTFYGRLPNDTRLAHHGFSFGQKRIVAFFWYLQCVRDAGSVVIADELVNGLHHEAVQVVVDGLAGLQAFLAGQDPLLFDFMEYASADDFRTRVVHCDWGERGWTWRNPTAAEAARFMSAYDIGWQPVNAILLTEGLW